MFFIYYFYLYRMKQRLPLLKIVHWRQLVRQLKKQKRIQEKSLQWLRFNILFDFCSHHLTSTVSSLLLTFIMKRRVKADVYLNRITSLSDQSAGVGGTIVDWKAEKWRTNLWDGANEKTDCTTRVSHKPLSFIMVAYTVECICWLMTCKCNINVWFVPFWREKYQELLSNFNKLQSEKTDIQQQFESGSSNVKTIEANIKVWIIQSNASYPVYTFYCIC